jgi:hypothetical protein
MPRTISQNATLNKLHAKKREPSVAAMASACGYRRPRNSFSNWSWKPNRTELQP